MRMRRFFAPVTLIAIATFGCEIIVGIEDRDVAAPLDAATSEESASPEASLPDVTVGTRDAANDTDAADAADAADAFDAALPDFSCFDVVTRIDAVSSNTTFEYGLRLTGNGLGGYLTRTTLPESLDNADVYFGTRASLSVPFSAFDLTSFSRPGAGDLNATETADGRTVYWDAYESPCGGGACRHVWRASRPSSGDPWGPAAEVFVSPDNEDFEPYVLPGGGEIYFTSSRGETFDIYRATNLGAAGYSVDKVDGNMVDLPFVAERSPVITGDNRVLFFARFSASYRIWVATRPSASVPFEAPRMVTFSEPVTIPNQQFNAFPSWVSPDGCVLYFAADREVSKDRDVYRSTRCDCVGKTPW
jgi:hypothetical protein